jgi:transcriptional regulator with XRE-family HTH domain
MSTRHPGQPQPARALLHARRISQRAVAARLGVSPQFLSQVLLGQAKPPPALQAHLAQLLEREPKDLFDSGQLMQSPAFPGNAGLSAQGDS